MSIREIISGKRRYYRHCHKGKILYPFFSIIWLQWNKYHLEERQPEHLQVFSVKDKVAIRTYLYDVQESYVIVLEPRGDNRYYLLTAYYLLGRNRYKIEHKLKRRLAKVY